MTADASDRDGAAGTRLRIRGQVQGVGFRPFVWALAREMGLRGRVLNDAAGVLVEVAGDGATLATRIAAEAPPLSRIDAIERAPYRFDRMLEGFEIGASEGGAADTRVTPDAATCPACRAEVMSADDRRAGYPFANCTHCGPRFSILAALPYDRARTSMAAFPMCDACRAEYEDPADRRFHAQPIACPDCGPRAWLEMPHRDGSHRAAPGDGLVGAAALLRSGGIVAVKGLGGFHLACDATDATAIATLRARKRRPAKPFALMAPLETVRAHASVSEAEARLLGDPAAPVVLLRKAGAPLPDGIAPGLDVLGWMLPYTPLHHLLLARVGRPLVMTSGNLSGAPQVIDDDVARVALAPFADALLMHDRRILRRLDDGVERLTATGPMVLRRARGRAPEPFALPEGFETAPPGLAHGGQLKAAACLVKGGAALLTQHVGDLDDAETWDDYLRALDDHAGLFDHAPGWLACDAHPGYRPSQLARARAAAEGLPLVEVQHHHAHLASVLAECGHPLTGGPVAGIVLDGLGWGADGTIWGGELLVGHYRGVARAAHLAPAPLPGGDAASRAPWRNLLARLDQAGLADLADAMMADRPTRLLRQAIAAGVNAPASSSAGRLFDAVAAFLGLVPDEMSYEGEAAMRLEALAQGSDESGAYPFGDGPSIDPAPLFHALAADRARGTGPEVMARRFHAGLAQAFAARARAEVAAGRAVAVALSGGCFQNALLTEMTVAALDGLPVLTHRRVPAGDGGLALGQAVIAAARQS